MDKIILVCKQGLSTMGAGKNSLKTLQLPPKNVLIDLCIDPGTVQVI